MSNVVNFAERKAQRDTQRAIDENIENVKNVVIPEIQAAMEEQTGVAEQTSRCAIEVLHGFLSISPHMLPLLVLEINHHLVHFSILSRTGAVIGQPEERAFLTVALEEYDDTSPKTFSLARPDELCNQVHFEHGWHLGKPMIQPIGYLWSFLMVDNWVFTHHEVDPVAMAITQQWCREGYRLTTTMNHDRLETTIREWEYPLNDH